MSSDTDLALAEIRGQSALVPRVGIVLGSGLDHLADQMNDAVRIPYTSLAGLPAPTAQGHSGRLTLGSWNDLPCVVAQGRCHLYEGRSVAEVTAVVRVMLELGVKRLILTNAAGGLNPQFRAGDVMVITDQMNFMFRSFGKRENKNESIGTLAMHPFDTNWIDFVSSRAAGLNRELRHGTYVGVLGPNYETRAEYRLFRRIGADAVGMSTIPEVSLAAANGVSVLGFSVITNEAKPDAPSTVSHQEVIDWAANASADLQRLISVALSVDSDFAKDSSRPRE